MLFDALGYLAYPGEIHNKVVEKLRKTIILTKNRQLIIQVSFGGELT